MTTRDVDRLVQDASIIRNRAKIQATVDNARAICPRCRALAELAKSYEITRKRSPRSIADLPSSTPEAEAFAKPVKSQGYRFVGPTSVVLGRIGRRAIRGREDVSAEEAMTLGPSTVRPSARLEAWEVSQAAEAPTGFRHGFGWLVPCARLCGLAGGHARRGDDQLHHDVGLRDHRGVRGRHLLDR
jgi:hypothetical protein